MGSAFKDVLRDYGIMGFQVVSETKASLAEVGKGGRIFFLSLKSGFFLVLELYQRAQEISF